MRKFNLYSALKMKVTSRAVPAPFPGKYPTRLAYAYLDNQRKLHTYLGKPTFNAVHDLYRAIRNFYHTRFIACEFDRQRALLREVSEYGLPFRFYWNSPIKNDLESVSTSRSQTFFESYFPGCSVGKWLSYRVASGVLSTRIEPPATHLSYFYRGRK